MACTLKTYQTLQAQADHSSHVGLICFPMVVESIDVLGLQDPSTSGGRKHITKKNSEHWIQVEVRQLVNGASEYGVRKWKDVKTNFFIASIHTPLYLKVHVDAQ